MDEESLVTIILSAFSTSEISVAKELLFTSISTTVKKVSRRKNKEQKDIEDIISAFKNVDPDNIPIFVAKELHKLPPVTFDHIDVTRLLKDIVLLQSELKIIKETYVTSEYLRAELNNMKYASLVNQDSNVTNRRGAYLLDSGPSGFMDITNTSATIMNTTEVETTSGKRQVQNNCIVQDCRSPSFVNKVADNTHAHTSQVGESCTHTSTTIEASATEQMTGTANHTGVSMTNDANIKNIKSLAEIVTTIGEWRTKDSTLENEWTEVQKRRHRNRMEGIRGKASIKPEDKFRPADLKIPLFVSNVHKNTSENDIIDYIFTKTNENVILQKIKMKTEKSYNAYKMLVTRHKLELFLNDEIWPDGVTCRRFMPYIHRYDEKKRNNSNENV